MSSSRHRPAPAPANPDRRHPALRPGPLALCALGLCALLVAVYWPCLRGSPLWDDAGHLTRADLRGPAGLGRIWFERGATQQYYPLLHTAFWIESHLWGQDPLGYHLVNLLWHAGSATLLAALVARLLARPPGGAAASAGALARVRGVAPWLAGLFFAVHPVTVESVAWISEQKNTLSTFFYLAAALVYLGSENPPSPRRLAGFGVLYVAALACKTVTATLPAALLVVAWWQGGGDAVRRHAARLLPFAAVGLVAGLVTAHLEKVDFIAVQNRLHPQSDEFGLTFGARLLLAARALLFYLGKLAYPQSLAFIYPRWQPSPADPGQYLYPLAVAALVVGLIRLARRNRAPLATFLIFAGTLFPALGFFDVYPFRYSYVADHFQHQACLAPLGLAAVGLSLVFFRGWDLGPRRLVRGAALGLLAALPLGWAATAHALSHNYASEAALYRGVLAVNPGAWMAHANLGLIEAREPAGLGAALGHFRAAVALDPGNGELHGYLGSALARASRPDEALAEFRLAVAHSPNFPLAHLNLGIALLSRGSGEGAVAEFATAARLDPRLAKAHELWGIAWSQSPGHAADAERELARALELDPNSFEARSSLGILLAAQPERAPEAAAQLAAAVALRPESPTAHYNLGFLLVQARRYEEARVQFAAVLQLDPANRDARDWLDRLAAFGK